jgi:hypothetical protein
MPSVDFGIDNYQVLLGGELQDLSETLGVSLLAAVVCGGKSTSVTVCAVRWEAPVPENRAGPGTTGVIFVPPSQYPWYVDLLRNDKPIACHLDLDLPKGHYISTGREAVGEGEEAEQPVASNPPNLDHWLHSHPTVRAALSWKGQDYDSWDDNQRTDLRTFFAEAWDDAPVDVPEDPPANVAIQLPFGEPRQVLSNYDAWRIYLGYIAHSLVLELGDRVPWSFSDWSTDQIAYLLDGGRMFKDAWFEGMEITRQDHGWAVPCPAKRTWEFLLNNALVRSTPLATVARRLAGSLGGAKFDADL